MRARPPHADSWVNPADGDGLHYVQWPTAQVKSACCWQGCSCREASSVASSQRPTRVSHRNEMPPRALLFRSKVEWCPRCGLMKPGHKLKRVQESTCQRIFLSAAFIFFF